MSTRLLSFLTGIERALLQDSGATPAAKWSSQRSVNFKDGLARVILTPSAGSEASAGGGSILLQSVLLGDGTTCLRATLGWQRSPATKLVAVHAKPNLDWAAEAHQIADAWLSGPPATATIESVSPVGATVSVGAKAAVG